MAIIKLETNKPTQISLKYKSALEKPGRYGVQFLYTLINGDRLFVPPVAHQEIQSLHVEAGEPFIVCKKSEGERIVWTVERVPSGPKLVTKKDLLNQLGDVLANGVPEKPANSVNTFYLDRATRLIDVFAEANRYAAEHYNGAVTKDDVRALCISVFIQCTPKAQANGTR